MYKIEKKIEKTNNGYIAELKCTEADTEHEFCVYGDHCVFEVEDGFWGPYYGRICVEGKDMEELEENVEEQMRKVRKVIAKRRGAKFETIEI
jgi:hypothetical protein